MKKKTLIIDARTGGDWSLDLTFAGLVMKHGAENVIDYPTHEKHREGEIVLTGDPSVDWGRERRSLGYTKSNSGLRTYPEHEIRKLLTEGTIERVFLDERPECYALYRQLGVNLFDVPVVVVAGHDRFWNDSLKTLDVYYRDRLEAIFVDNWRHEYAKHPLAHVYSWCVNFDHYWDRKRAPKENLYDISFMGYNSHPDRLMYVEHVRKRWGHLNNYLLLETKPDTMSSFIPKREYFKVMAQSKICLNLRGAAENGKTLRFYEIPYVGSFMISQDTGIVQAAPPLKSGGMHYASFKNVEELDRAIEYYLNYAPMDRCCGAATAYQLVMEHHTALARVEQMYEVFDGQA